MIQQIGGHPKGRLGEKLSPWNICMFHTAEEMTSKCNLTDIMNLMSVS